MRHIIWILALAACTSKSTTEELCDRMQSCNLLRAGVSVDECVQDLDTALGQLPPTQKDEVEYDLQQCLDHPACSGLASCVQSYIGSGSGG
jgi:hypothetical protein